MAKSGPKPKPPEEVLSERLSIAMTPPQKELIQKAFEIDGGNSLSAWMLDAVLKRAKSVTSKARRKG